MVLGAQPSGRILPRLTIKSEEKQTTSTRRPGVQFQVGTVLKPNFTFFARDSKKTLNKLTNNVTQGLARFLPIWLKYGIKWRESCEVFVFHHEITPKIFNLINVHSAVDIICHFNKPRLYVNHIFVNRNNVYVLLSGKVMVIICNT